MMMSRKSLWFSQALVLAGATLIFASANVQAQKNKQPERASGPPSLSLSADQSMIKGCNDESARVRLVATASSPDGAALRYKWSTSGGRLRGDGANSTWDLAGVQPGVYQAFVEVDDGRDFNCVSFSSVTVNVSDCPPPPPPPPTCPTVNVSCPEAGAENAPVTFTANVSGGTPNMTAGYNWTISAGKIISGQGTPSITVDTTGLAGQTVRANLEVTGFGTPCPASCSVSIPIMNKPRKFDEYYDIARNDEKARLDNFAIQLQAEPGSQGYILVYPSSRAKSNDAQARAQRISDYLINTRGIDSHRVVVTMGPQRETWLFELWVVPEGAPPPTPNR
jgi:PKD-like domain